MLTIEKIKKSIHSKDEYVFTFNSAWETKVIPITDLLFFLQEISKEFDSLYLDLNVEKDWDGAIEDVTLVVQGYKEELESDEDFKVRMDKLSIERLEQEVQEQHRKAQNLI